MSRIVSVMSRVAAELGRPLIRGTCSMARMDRAAIRGTGLRLRVDPTSRFGAELREFGFRPSEPFVLPLLRRVLSDGDVFLDLGAHWGTYSIVASELVGSSGRVISVEPHPANIKRLRANADLNGCTNLSVVPYAVGAGEKRATLMLDGTGANLNRLTDDTPVAGRVDRVLDALRIRPLSEECQVTTLGSILENAGDRIRLMKMDIEGGEWALAGDLERHADRFDVMMVELHPRWSAEDDTSAIYGSLAGRRVLYGIDRDGRRLEPIHSETGFRQRLHLYYFVSILDDAELGGFTW